MSLQTFTAAVAAAAVLTGTLLASTAGCAGQQMCGGQCGPPYGLDVAFRPGATTQAATTTLNKCAADPVVERVGHLKTGRRSPDLTPNVTATIYTRAESITRTGTLLTCLNHSPAVSSAAFPG